MQENRVKIAVVGVGDISGIYLTNVTGIFREMEIIGVCDLVREKAAQAAEMYKIPKIYDAMEDAFADPVVDIILNLTRPNEHYGVTKAALEAGKHVYSEKPLAATWEEGQELAELAAERGLMLGGAPDTFLGAGLQTCRALIDMGMIGKPIGARAAMICRGHEGWHPDPEFYYKRGGGPMMDMGPYYVTALINLLGGVAGVTGVTRTNFPQRTIGSEAKRGAVIDVEASTDVHGILEFESGAVGTIFTSFDTVYDKQAHFEVYGSGGTLRVPDPNTFGGPVVLLRPEDGTFREMPLLFPYKENSRGLGLLDMARALTTGRPARTDVRQTLHVLEVMTAFEVSSQVRAYVGLETRYEQEATLGTLR